MKINVIFDIVCNLSIAIWDFSAVSGKRNRFYLSQLALTLTFPEFEILARYDLALQTNITRK